MLNKKREKQDGWEKRRKKKQRASLVWECNKRIEQEGGLPVIHPSPSIVGRRIEVLVVNEHGHAPELDSRRPHTVSLIVRQLLLFRWQKWLADMGCKEGVRPMLDRL